MNLLKIGLLLFKPKEHRIFGLYSSCFSKTKERSTQHFLSQHKSGKWKKAVEQGKNQSDEGGESCPILMHKTKIQLLQKSEA